MELSESEMTQHVQMDIQKNTESPNESPALDTTEDEFEDPIPLGSPSLQKVMKEMENTHPAVTTTLSPLVAGTQLDHQKLYDKTPSTAEYKNSLDYDSSDDEEDGDDKLKLKQQFSNLKLSVDSGHKINRRRNLSWGKDVRGNKPKAATASGSLNNSPSNQRRRRRVISTSSTPASPMIIKFKFQNTNVSCSHEDIVAASSSSVEDLEQKSIFSTPKMYRRFPSIDD